MLLAQTLCQDRVVLGEGLFIFKFLRFLCFFFELECVLDMFLLLTQKYVDLPFFHGFCKGRWGGRAFGGTLGLTSH